MNQRSGMMPMMMDLGGGEELDVSGLTVKRWT